MGSCMNHSQELRAPFCAVISLLTRRAPSSFFFSRTTSVVRFWVEIDPSRYVFQPSPNVFSRVQPFIFFPFLLVSSSSAKLVRKDSRDPRKGRSEHLCWPSVAALGMR